MTSTRARWTEGIPDLTSRLHQAGNYLPVSKVAEATGYSPKTILDLLSREKITSDRNPQAPLSRPAARIDSTPLYSLAQVEECLRRKRFESGSPQPLPSVTEAEAIERGWIGYTEIAQIARVHEQTVRKWASRQGDFPPAIARRERGDEAHSGVPFVVRDGVAVRNWLRRNGYGEAVTKWEKRHPKVLLRERRRAAAESDQVAV